MKAHLANFVLAPIVMDILITLLVSRHMTSHDSMLLFVAFHWVASVRVDDMSDAEAY